MDTKELRKMNKEDLLLKLREKKEKLQQLKFKVSLEEHKQVRDLRVLKKEIARILTILNESGRQDSPTLKDQTDESKNIEDKDKE